MLTCPGQGRPVVDFISTRQATVCFAMTGVDRALGNFRQPLHCLLGLAGCGFPHTSRKWAVANCRHFGEAPAACERMCDICVQQAPVKEQDVTALASKLCRILVDHPTPEKRATLIQLLDKARIPKV